MCAAGSAVVAEVSDDNLFSIWFSQLAIIDLTDLLEIPEDHLPQKESHPLRLQISSQINQSLHSDFGNLMNYHQHCNADLPWLWYLFNKHIALLLF